jgi:Zn ribbon nucleic-acid-binding protein
MTDSGDYQQAWQGYKRQGKLWIALFILYVPAVVGAAMLSVRYLHTPKPAIALALAWMAFTLYLGARINLWRCPRCGNPFSGTLWRSKGIFASQCVHCGLAKYGNGDVSASSQAAS